MSGLRELKKERTRRRIAAVALRLFAERGFEAVTVNEIAEAAEVAKVTLFKYFPTKEALVLHGVGEEDLAGIVAARGPGRTPLEALREHYRASAAEPVADAEALVAQLQVIFASPALSDAANNLLYGQRQALARVLANEPGEAGEPGEKGELGGPEKGRRDLVAALTAAQITASMLTVQEAYFCDLVEGVTPQEAARRLGEAVELAFDLLEHGLPNRNRREG
ncbi:TetR family transcriptional regulator [Nonomuraea sp. NPDC050310]|uniref:TetR family transcriptional regulator n=1 Tax=unclassified Nonomuraea TaxID=2593643 RepID=UPI0033D10930